MDLLKIVTWVKLTLLQTLAVEHQWGIKTTCQFLYFSQIIYPSKSLEEPSGVLAHFSGCVGIPTISL